MLARQLEHLVLVEELSLVTELIAGMAEQGGRLITDPPRAQSLGNLGQRFQLLTDTDPIGGRGCRHATGPADPTHCTRCAVGGVGSRLLHTARLDSEVALESIDDGAEAL